MNSTILRVDQKIIDKCILNAQNCQGKGPDLMLLLILSPCPTASMLVLYFRAA